MSSSFHARPSASPISYYLQKEAPALREDYRESSNQLTMRKSE